MENFNLENSNNPNERPTLQELVHGATGTPEQYLGIQKKEKPGSFSAENMQDMAEKMKKVMEDYEIWKAKNQFFLAETAMKLMPLPELVKKPIAESIKIVTCMYANKDFYAMNGYFDEKPASTVATTSGFKNFEDRVNWGLKKFKSEVFNSEKTVQARKDYFLGTKENKAEVIKK